VGVTVARDFDQTELEFVDRQRLARILVEMLQSSGSQPRLRQIAVDPAMLSATDDGNVESGFDLAQVLVECAAKILQPNIVERLQGQRQRAGRSLRGAQGVWSGVTGRSGRNG
jgi:hypothetical protein